jgi:hypothetical protein
MEIFKFMVPEIIFGRGTLNLVGESASRLGATRIFLVTDEGVKKSGWVDEAVKHLNDIGLEYQVWQNQLKTLRTLRLTMARNYTWKQGVMLWWAWGVGVPMMQPKQSLF